MVYVLYIFYIHFYTKPTCPLLMTRGTCSRAPERLDLRHSLLMVTVRADSIGHMPQGLVVSEELNGQTAVQTHLELNSDR